MTTERTHVLNGKTVTDTYDAVLPGENFQQFAERTGVHMDRLIELNDAELEAEARLRGFSHSFPRYVPDEDGGAAHAETGVRCRIVNDRHVFGGQQLIIQRVDKED